MANPVKDNVILRPNKYLNVFFKALVEELDNSRSAAMHLSKLVKAIK